MPRRVNRPDLSQIQEVHCKIECPHGRCQAGKHSSCCFSCPAVFLRIAEDPKPLWVSFMEWKHWTKLCLKQNSHRPQGLRQTPKLPASLQEIASGANESPGINQVCNLLISLVQAYSTRCQPNVKSSSTSSSHRMMDSKLSLQKQWPLVQKCRVDPGSCD